MKRIFSPLYKFNLSFNRNILETMYNKSISFYTIHRTHRYVNNPLLLFIVPRECTCVYTAYDVVMYLI